MLLRRGAPHSTISWRLEEGGSEHRMQELGAVLCWEHEEQGCTNDGGLLPVLPVDDKAGLLMPVLPVDDKALLLLTMFLVYALLLLNMLLL